MRTNYSVEPTMASSTRSDCWGPTPTLTVSAVQTVFLSFQCRQAWKPIVLNLLCARQKQTEKRIGRCSCLSRIISCAPQKMSTHSPNKNKNQEQSEHSRSRYYWNFVIPLLYCTYSCKWSLVPLLLFYCECYGWRAKTTTQLTVK